MVKLYLTGFLYGERGKAVKRFTINDKGDVPYYFTVISFKDDYYYKCHPVRSSVFCSFYFYSEETGLRCTNSLQLIRVSFDVVIKGMIQFKQLIIEEIISIITIGDICNIISSYVV